jgi:hypothetical protein
MKNLFALTTSLLAISSFAQVEVDKGISLTGTNGERYVTNLEVPVNGTDAVNKDYVDGLVSANGPASFTMITDESATAMNFGSAIRYCRNLTEGGNSDWKLPTFQELIEVISKGGNTVPNDSSSSYLWLAEQAGAGSDSSSIKRIRLSDGYSPGTDVLNATARVRCVR